MSFFDRQGISEDLLRAQCKIKTDHSSLEEITLEHSDDNTDSASESKTDYNLEDDITTLRDFSCISINKDNTVFTMHRLVQLTVHVWLKTGQELERWKEQFIMILWQRFPTGEYKNWAQCQPLFPHVKSAMSQPPESQDSLGKWAMLLYKGAWYAQESGNIVESMDMASESRKQRILMFGSQGEQTLESSAMLASAHRLGGRWEEAEQLEVQVMETRKTKLGADHPDTLTRMANLASTYRDQGRWEEAEQLFLQVMETRKTKLGADHPSTLTSMGNLACTLHSSGQPKPALLLMGECVLLCDRKLGPDHPHTMSFKSALNEWRGKAESPSFELINAPAESKDDQILASPTETSAPVSKPDRHGRRRIFSRLFSRK
jgi:hypothetical protein